MICTKCHKEKGLHFSRNKNRRKGIRGQYHPWCHDCMSKEMARRQKEGTAFLQSLKDVPCKDCGKQFPPCAMDFDHVKGKKSFGIGNHSAYSIERLKKEVAKCEVVCAVCHRIRTENRKNEVIVRAA